MPLILNKALNLTEGEIRQAMALTKSNAEASRYIGCDISTYKRYALRYRDEESGKTLWELHKNQSGRGTSRARRANQRYASYLVPRITIEELLSGERRPAEPLAMLERLFYEMAIKKECYRCGCKEVRQRDGKPPLLFIWRDGDRQNFKRNNIDVICYNCYFLTISDIYKVKKLLIKGYRL